MYKIMIPQEEPKQETLEEVAERLYPLEVGYGVFDRNCQISDLQEAFVEGGKHQAKIMYSVEEVIQFYKNYEMYVITTPIREVIGFTEWFEKFKK